MKSFWNKLFAKHPKQARTADCGTFRVKLKSDTILEDTSVEYADKLISLQREAKQEKVIKRLTPQVEVKSRV